MAMMVVVAEKLVTFKRLFAKTAAKKFRRCKKKLEFYLEKLKIAIYIQADFFHSNLRSLLQMIWIG